MSVKISTCSRCPHQFCWLCMSSWSRHLNCNRYQSEKSHPKTTSKIDRLSHFWIRYSEHKRSLKLEQEFYDKFNSNREAKEVKKGFIELLECRQMLMNTYVFVFYLEDDKEDDVVLNKTIFETNQADLEAATERLSGLLQEYFNVGSVNEICEDLKAKYRYCEIRRNVLLKHVDEGNENMFWRFRQ